MRPLEGIKVLDLSKVIAGPQCAMMLGDLGADVMKVEMPKVGDDARAFTPFQNGMSALYAAVNRNKGSITLNMKNPKALEIFYKLVKDSDVVIENMITGGAEKLKIGYHDLKKINPGLIYCSVSGYGRKGPYAKKGGYELMAQAMGGVMSVTGVPGVEQPARVGYSMTDIGSGFLATIGVLAALIKRSKTGEGEWVQASLLNTQMGFASYFLTQYKVTGVNPKPAGTKHPSMAPYQDYQASDGKLLIGMSNEAQWKRLISHPKFASLGEKPEYGIMADRVANRDQLQVDMENILATMTVKEALKIFDSLNVPCGSINTVKDIFDDEYIVDNLLTTLTVPEKGDFVVPKFPVEFEGIETDVRKNPPLLGQDTEDVLHRYGYTDEQIEELREEGAI